MTLDRQPSRRRSNNDGTVFWADDRQRWIALHRWKDPDGTPRTRKLTGRTEREATQKLRQVQHDQRTGHDITAHTLTVADLVHRWFNEVAPIRQSPRTLKLTRGLIDTRIVPTVGHLKVVDVIPDHIDRALSRWVDDELARSTISKLRTILIASFTFAEKRRMVTWNPARLAPMPPVSTTPAPAERAALTEQQVRELLDASKDSRHHLYMWLGFTIGARPGELSGLCWEQLDLTTGTLHIDRALRYLPTGPQLGPTKTVRSDRHIQLSSELVEALREHRRRQAIERDTHGDWPAEWAGLVFPTATGRPVDDHTLRRDIKALGKRIGLNNVTPYVMRHTVTSILSENDGVPPEQLADLLGHVDTTMVMRHYRHRLTRQVNVATALGSRLATGSTP